MEKPLVSVIILYNSVQRLDECLEDLAQQTIINQLDVIPLLISDREQPDGEKRFINRAEAINFGISDATGDYILQLDQEDRLRHDAFEVFTAQFAKYPETSVLFANVLTSAMRMKNFNPTAVRDGFRWGVASLEKLEQFNCVGPHPCWRKALHAEFGLLNVDHPNLAFWEFWLKIFAPQKFSYLDDVLSFTLHPPVIRIDGIAEKLAEIDIRNAHYIQKMPTPEGNPRISVIISTRNRLSLLKIAVQSLINQTWRNWEAIIINDGGEPIEKIKEDFSGDERIRIVNNPVSIERSTSRNIGIEQAKGQFICFLDDDDVLYRHHFELGVKMMSQFDEQCEILYFGANGATAKLVNDRVEINQLHVVYNDPFDRERFLTVNYIPLQALIYRSGIFASGERFDEEMNCMEDLDLLVRLSHRHTFTHIPLITSEIRYLKQLEADDLASHISSLRKLYVRYAEYTNGSWDIQWKQEQKLRGLKLDIARMESSQPAVSILLPPVNEAQKLRQLVDEIINQTRYGDFELILTATNEGHNLQQFASTLPVKSQFVQLSSEASLQECYSAAAAKANGEYVAILAPGCAPATGHWLGELVETIQNEGANFASAVVIDRKDGFLINEFCYALAGAESSASLTRLYANHSLFSPWLRNTREVEIPSLGTVLLSKEDFLNANGFGKSSSFALALADLACRMRMKNLMRLKVNPFSVLYSNSEASPEAVFTESDHDRLTSVWGTGYCKTEVDYYTDDKLWNLDPSAGNCVPNYQEYETCIVEQAKNSKNVEKYLRQC